MYQNNKSGPITLIKTQEPSILNIVLVILNIFAITFFHPFIMVSQDIKNLTIGGNNSYKESWDSIVSALYYCFRGISQTQNNMANHGH